MGYNILKPRLEFESSPKMTYLLIKAHGSPLHTREFIDKDVLDNAKEFISRNYNGKSIAHIRMYARQHMPDRHFVLVVDHQINPNKSLVSDHIFDLKPHPTNPNKSIWYMPDYSPVFVATHRRVKYPRAIDVEESFKKLRSISSSSDIDYFAMDTVPVTRNSNFSLKISASSLGTITNPKILHNTLKGWITPEELDSYNKELDKQKRQETAQRTAVNPEQGKSIPQLPHSSSSGSRNPWVHFNNHLYHIEKYGDPEILDSGGEPDLDRYLNYRDRVAKSVRVSRHPITGTTSWIGTVTHPSGAKEQFKYRKTYNPETQEIEGKWVRSGKKQIPFHEDIQ